MLKRLLAFAIACLAATSILASTPESVVLDVKGMDCATCPITVKAVLKRQQGVHEVQVDMPKRTVEVKFDAAKVTPERIAQLVTEAGYPSTPRK